MRGKETTDLDGRQMGIKGVTPNLQRKVTMERDRSSKKSRRAVKLVAMFIALFAVTSIQSGSAFSEVKCYKGNTQGGNYVGELSSVTNLQNAGRDCNSTYPDCQGQCLGCIYDSDFVQDICFDSSGNKFLNPN